ncbi:MAG: hypothetical protein KF851_11775 [Pirellulaceae bacterium]|nr:hypothetical protein [Pirellulaceae bacterium]
MSRIRSTGNFLLPVLAMLFAAWGWSTLERVDRIEDHGQLRLAVSQDNVAWRLAKRGTFTIDLTDQEWREQIKLSPEETKWVDRWADFSQGSTTRIALLFPFFSATVYSVIGYRPEVVCWLQIIFNVVSLATLLYVARQFVSRPWVIGMAIVGIMADPFLWWNSQRFVVNDLSVGIVALLAASLFRALNQAKDRATQRENFSTAGMMVKLLHGIRHRPWLWVGFGFGLEFLNRPTSQFWILWLMLLWPWMLVSWLVSGRRVKSYLQGSGLVACGFLIIALPWMLRNATKVGWLAPGGVDPWVQINGGYQDRTINQLGRVWPAITRTQERSITRQFHELDNFQREVVLAETCLGNAISWQSRNFDQFPKLFLLKLLDHFCILNQRNYVSSLWHSFLLALTISVCLARRATWGVAVGGILILSGLTTGLTWSDGCFLSLPLRSLMILAAAVGIGNLLSLAWFQRMGFGVTRQS